MTPKHLLLYRLAEIMYENGKQNIPVDDLFDDDQIGDFVRSIQIDSPYQQLIFEGVLTELVHDERLFVIYTVEGFFHYILGEVLYIRINNQNRPSKFILNLLLKNEIKGISYAIQNALVRFINSDNYNHLIWLIDNSDKKFLDLYIYPLYHFIKTKSYNISLGLMLQKISKNDYDIIFLLIQYLEQNGEHEIIKNTCNYVFDKIEIKPISIEHSKLIIIILYYLKSIENLKYDHIVEQVIKIVKKSSQKKSIYEISHYLILMEYYKYAILILKKLTKYKISAYNLIGICYYKSKKYNYAFRNFSKYHFYAIKENDDRKISEALYNISTIYWEFKDFEKSISLNYDALAIEKKIIGQYHPSYLVSLFSIVLNLRILHQYLKAEELLEKCLTIAQNTIDSNNSLLFDIYLIRGANFSDLEKNIESIYSYKKAIEFCPKEEVLNRNPNYFLQEQYYIIAEKMFKLRNFIDAEKNYLCSIKIYENLPNTNNFIPPYFEIGNCYREISNYTLSIDYYEKAISITKYSKLNYFYNPKFWLGIVYYELAESLIIDNQINKEIYNYFRISKNYLKKWENRIDNDEWNLYFISIFNNVNERLKKSI